MWFTRAGELDGLSSMIADLIESNLQTHPERSRLLKGRAKWVKISAEDLDAHVGLVIGGGGITVGDADPNPHLWIYADSETLIELPNAKLLGGLPSVAHPSGRAVAKKLLKGQLKIRGIHRIGLLRRVQRLLSVSS